MILLEQASVPVKVNCPIDEFENAIRKVGIVAACEWFGHKSDSDFTAGAIQVLAVKSRV